MPNVLIKEEVSQMVDFLRPLALESIKTYFRNVDLGKKFSPKELADVRMICYVRNLLMSWEQSEYSNQEFNNLINDVDVRNLYSATIKTCKKYVR